LTPHSKANARNQEGGDHPAVRHNRKPGFRKPAALGTTPGCGVGDNWLHHHRSLKTCYEGVCAESHHYDSESGGSEQSAGDQGQAEVRGR